jgi:hypothetical protein
VGRLLALLALTGTVGLVAAPGCAAGGHRSAASHAAAASGPAPTVTRPRGGVVTVTPPAPPTGTRWVDVVVDGRIVGSGTASPFAYRVDTAALSPGTHRLWTTAWDAGFAHHRSAPVDLVVSPRPHRRGPAGVGTERGLRRLVGRAGRRGGDVVRIRPGVITLHGMLTVPASVDVIGAGAGATTLKAAGPTGAPVIRLGGSSASIRNLTVDAGGATFAAVDVSQPGAYDDLVQGVRLTGLGSRAAGVNLWADGRRSSSVQDTTIDGGSTASAGVLATASSTGDGVLRTRVRNVRDFGIAFIGLSGGRTVAAPGAVAVHDVVTGVQNPDTNNGTNEAGIWLGGAANTAYSNTIRNTGWDGIWTGNGGHDAAVVDNDVRGTPVGAYLEHGSSGVLVADNRFSMVRIGVNVEWSYGGGGSTNVDVRGNQVIGAQWGVWLSVGTNNSSIAGNRLLDSTDGAVQLQGVQGTDVRDNDLRDRRRTPRQEYCVVETAGLTDSGATATSDDSVVQGNDCRGSTQGVADFMGTGSKQSGNRWP